MTWTAPAVARTEGPLTGAERPMLEGFLDAQRQTLLWKCSGLTAEQLTTASVAPSKLTLLGLLRHMTDVERWWFRTRAGGLGLPGRYDAADNPDAEFDNLDDTPVPAAFAAFDEECRLSRELAATLPLEHTFRHRTDLFSLRWVYVHMIEEYARHNGHADLIRERIDGATGE